MKLWNAVILWLLSLCGMSLPENVVDCWEYVNYQRNPPCILMHMNRQLSKTGCISNGWYSKVNSNNPNKAIDADEICKDEGYRYGVDRTSYGGNWGYQCGFPGYDLQRKSSTNRAGGSPDNLSNAVSWKCWGVPKTRNVPTRQPTSDRSEFHVPGIYEVVDCGKNLVYHNGVGTAEQRECHARDMCVGEGWFSKINYYKPNDRVNAIEICRDHGFDGVDNNEYGGNYKKDCNYPGDKRGQPNHGGGELNEFGLTVSWKCTGSRGSPIPLPTPEPTHDAAVDDGYPELPQGVYDCGNYHEDVPDDEKECNGDGMWCVQDHWYSVDSEDVKVNAEEVCKDQGYRGVGEHYGTTGGFLCRYPGSAVGKDIGPVDDTNGVPNKEGNLNRFGGYVTWQCKLPRAQPGMTLEPTEAPTKPPVPPFSIRPEDVKVNEPIVYCGEYITRTKKKCGGRCVGDGWFSKINREDPYKKVDAQKICLDNGFGPVDEENYGGNAGVECRFPGNIQGTANKMGDDLTNFGLFVAWKCTVKEAETPKPTPMPTADFGLVVDCGLYEAAGDKRECAQIGRGCVGAGWFSKTNTEGRDRRIDADEWCKEAGYSLGMDREMYGGNYGHQCRFPGYNMVPNRVGGEPDNLGYTVSWKCNENKTPKPTPKPTKGAPTVMPTYNRARLMDRVTDCYWWRMDQDDPPRCGSDPKAECLGRLHSAIEGWFSKVNKAEPFARINLHAACKALGYDSVGEYGGNWGNLCRYPGANGVPNKEGGSLDNFGMQVSWQCLKDVPTPQPTKEPEMKPCSEYTGKKRCLENPNCQYKKQCFDKGVDPCEGVTNRMTKKLIKTYCNLYKNDGDKCDDTAGCKYKKGKKGKAGKCKSTKKVKCSNVPREVCCEFDGCAPEGTKCGGKFNGFL